MIQQLSIPILHLRINNKYVNLEQKEPLLKGTLFLYQPIIRKAVIPITGHDHVIQQLDNSPTEDYSVILALSIVTILQRRSSGSPFYSVPLRPKASFTLTYTKRGLLRDPHLVHSHNTPLPLLRIAFLFRSASPKSKLYAHFTA